MLVGGAPVVVCGLFLALFGLAVVHTRSRIAGATLTAVWALCALVFGAVRFHEGTDLPASLLGISTSPVIFYLTMLGIFAFNVAVILRAARLRWLSRAERTAPPPSAS